MSNAIPIRKEGEKQDCLKKMVSKGSDLLSRFQRRAITSFFIGC